MTTIVLVEPLFAGNLGAVARIAANFDSTDLVLVRPQCSPQDDEALKYAVGDPAKAILKNARTVDSLSAALAQCSLSVAFVRKDNRSPKTTHYIDKIVAALPPVALVFGREDHGLSNQDSELCTFEASIHTSNTYPSMNLSHAVAVVLHQIFTANANSKPSNASSQTTIELATHEDVAVLVEHLRGLMVDAQITTGDNPDKLLRPMANALRRAQLTQSDVGHFRAFLSKTQNALHRARSK